MMTQTDLFDQADKIDDGRADENETDTVSANANPIAVPCGFMDRHNNRCRRLGNWPVMVHGKQMVCRGRPMVHCDPACFRGDPPPLAQEPGGDDVTWGDPGGEYGDDQ